MQSGRASFPPSSGTLLIYKKLARFTLGRPMLAFVEMHFASSELPHNLIWRSENARPRPPPPPVPTFRGLPLLDLQLPKAVTNADRQNWKEAGVAQIVIVAFSEGGNILLEARVLIH